MKRLVSNAAVKIEARAPMTMEMDRRTLVGGVALTAFSQSTIPVQADDVAAADADDQTIWRRYAARRDGRRTAVLLLHGLRGFQRKLSAYKRYANALTAEGIDAYMIEYYTPIDGVALKAMESSADREAYESRHYDAWSERVSSVITKILQSDVGSDRIGLLGFSLGGFVAAATAAGDRRVTALAVLYGGMPRKITAHVKRMPPTIELHGDSDRNVPLAAGRVLVTLAKAAGAPTEQVIYPGKAHGFDFADDDPAAIDAVDRVARFFKAQFGVG